MTTKLIEYDTQKVDINLVIKSFNNGGVLVTLLSFKHDFFQVEKLDQYTDVDGNKALIICVKGHTMRDLKGYKTVMVRTEVVENDQ